MGYNSFTMRQWRRTSFWTGFGAAVAGAALAGMALAAPPQAAAPAGSSENAAFFETSIRPLLSASCYSCHGKDAALGGLRLDSRAFLLKGGATGPAIVPGDPAKSLLITAVHQSGALKMPQGGRLKPEEIAELENWIRMGAPWPETAAAAPMVGGPGAMSFWSLQPIRKPAIPKVRRAAWAKTPVDAFILAKLEAKGLTPAPAADKRTLLRRVSFDLTGLPPTPAEADAFLNDHAPNAYEKVVDRLLSSPRYGERWGRMWLDVARYSDTKGYVFVEDRNYPNAYTYRDWVIRSFNEDLPFDKFVTYQLAADLAPEVKNGPDKRPLAALGFLTVGRRFLNSQPDIMDDRIDVTMRGFEAMTVACARCHDHKFDPIPTADYYSLYGVFASVHEAELPISPANISQPYEAHVAALKANQSALDGVVTAEVKRLRGIVEKDGATPTLAEPVRQALQSLRIEALPTGDTYTKLVPAFSPEATARLADLNHEKDKLNGSAPPTPELAMAMQDSDQPNNPHIFKRGNPNNQGDAVPRRFPLCLSPAGAPRPEWTVGSGRLEMARSLVSRDNPRTARVFVNRVWMHHFGAGIVRTPSDFGKQGERPSHPELLDYLAARFEDEGWSVKKLQRMIVLSATYQQASDSTVKTLQADPENRLLAHQTRQRLDMEEMRDSLLWASGKLDTSTVGGKSVQLWTAPFTARRAVYGFIERQNLPGTFRTFDFATPDATSAKRFETTIPQQALFFMNSPFAVEQATLLADRPDLRAATPQEESRNIRRLYLRLFDRLPDTDETHVGLAYLRAPDIDFNRPLFAPPAWSYGFGGLDAATQRLVGFTPFAQFKGDHYQPENVLPSPQVPLGFVSLTANGGHPGRDSAHAAVRRWTAPSDMTVAIAGILHHAEARGDGVRGRIVSSRTGLLGEWSAHGSESPTPVAAATVRKGDTIDFVVDCKGDDAFDSFTWTPTVRQVGGSGVWSAETEFAGPMVVKEQRLTPWERYAQALLMTNEFLFVD
jgi:cytochrome c553